MHWEGPLAGVSSRVSCPMLRRMASPMALSLISCSRSILPALAWTHAQHANRGLAGSEEFSSATRGKIREVVEYPSIVRKYTAGLRCRASARPGSRPLTPSSHRCNKGRILSTMLRHGMPDCIPCREPPSAPCTCAKPPCAPPPAPRLPVHTMHLSTGKI